MHLHANSLVMKMEYLYSAFKMLTSQLKEEEEKYQKALNNKQSRVWEIKEIQQRIKALRHSLLSLEKWQEAF